MLEHSHPKIASYPILPFQKATLSIISYHFTIHPTSQNSTFSHFIYSFFYHFSFSLPFPLFLSQPLPSELCRSQTMPKKKKNSPQSYADLKPGQKKKKAITIRATPTSNQAKTQLQSKPTDHNRSKPTPPLGLWQTDPPIQTHHLTHKTPETTTMTPQQNPPDIDHKPQELMTKPLQADSSQLVNRLSPCISCMHAVTFFTILDIGVYF